MVLGARAARSLRLWFRRRGVENDAIGGTFGDLASIVLDGEGQERMLLTKNSLGFRTMSDGGQVRTGANYCRGDTQDKGLGIRRGENGRASVEDGGGTVVFQS